MKTTKTHSLPLIWAEKPQPFACEASEAGETCFKFKWTDHFIQQQL